MRFLHGQIKARKGDIIQVHFSQPTRILIMGKRDYEKYKNNLTFSYVGGQQEDSPYEYTAPKDMVYSVVVEKGSFYDPLDVTASVKVVPGVVAPPVEPVDDDVEETADETEDATSTDEDEAEVDAEVVAEGEDTEDEERS